VKRNLSNTFISPIQLSKTTKTGRFNLVQILNKSYFFLV